MTANLISADIVRGLAGVRTADVATVGGKAASLGELSAAGAETPPGFVVTTRAFELTMAALDPARSIPAEIGRLAGDDTAIAVVTQRIRRRITEAQLPVDVRAVITAHYRGLDDCNTSVNNTAVAVRSSATEEDSDQASLAGLQDTYLWVRGASAVLDGVRGCWASLYNAEAVSYRLRMGIGDRDLAMAVVVQRMVDPVCAGVMFTCSPTSGDRSVIAVEGTWGLGSAMVSGDVTPDRYVVSKVTGEIVTRTVAAKDRLHKMDDSGQGVAVTDVPAPLRDKPCLSDDDVRALARLGRQVERHFGTAQDVEWAMVAGPGGRGNSFIVLQSRPETYWSPRAAGPLAQPRPRAVDHVFAGLSRVVRVDPESLP